MPRRVSSNLTELKIKNAKPKDKPYKLADGDGMHLYISPSGGKLWRVKYYFDGVEKLLSLGPYPALSIAEARKRLAEVKTLLVQGIDPSVHKKAVKNADRAVSAHSYEVIAREWFAKFSPNWSESHKSKTMARQENDVFPHIGSKPISQITPPELLAVLRIIEQRVALETAHRALQDCGRIFRYAIATGRAERDPAADLRGALPPAKGNNFASITDPKKVGALLRAIDGYEYGGTKIVTYALRLAPLVFVRPGELRKAQWKEFDFDKAEWRIPAARMKMKEVHIVPLARQALVILHELKQYTGHGVYLFPSPHKEGKSPTISDMALLMGLRRMGYTGQEMTVHGFRSMASTLLNELGYNRDWIERQLAHSERNNIQGAYNYAEYLSERRKMMQEYADYLYGLRVQAASGASPTAILG